EKVLENLIRDLLGIRCVCTTVRAVSGFTIHTTMKTAVTTYSSSSKSSRGIARVIYLLLGVLLAALPAGLRAQTYLSEDFESGVNSTNFSDQGTGNAWATNTTYQYAGSNSAWFQTNGGNGNTNDALTSRVFNLSGPTKPLLTFNHIAAT